jgi:uncharacterized protein YndB with AHSA1/START domain
MGPIEIRLQIDIRAPVEVVWPMLVDWEQLGRWMLEASRFRVTSEQREGVGAEIEARVRIGGITTTDSVRVTRWEPPHVLGIDHLGSVKGHAVLECIPRDQGTRVEWAERLEPPFGVIGGIGIRALKPIMAKTFARDLGVLKRLAEIRAGTRSPGKLGGNGARPARGPEASSLFARWFWLVYLPLGLLATVLTLVATGLMPGALRLPLIASTGVWSALAIRLLLERKRRQLAVPAPRSIVFGIGAVALLAVTGGLLTWIGIGRLSTSAGLAMLLVGCFFMLMAVFAPMFKLVDSGFRLAARALTRRSKPPAPPPPPAGETNESSESSEPSYSTKS